MIEWIDIQDRLPHAEDRENTCLGDHVCESNDVLVTDGFDVRRAALFVRDDGSHLWDGDFALEWSARITHWANLNLPSRKKQWPS